MNTSGSNSKQETRHAFNFVPQSSKKGEERRLEKKQFYVVCASGLIISQTQLERQFVMVARFDRGISFVRTALIELDPSPRSSLSHCDRSPRNRRSVLELHLSVTRSALFALFIVASFIRFPFHGHSDQENSSM